MQNDLKLGFGVVTKPADAPTKIVAQVESEAQALRVMVRAKSLKLDYIAAAIGKSRPYVSLMLTGKRPIPEKLIGPLCAATGSNLLAQFVALQHALEPEGEVERLAALLRNAA